MSKVTIIGDVHGKTGLYRSLLRRVPEGQRSIQIGDMGIGFANVVLNPGYLEHKFFRGNHDNPTKCRKHPNYLGDWGHWPDEKLFWVAGASSIDRAMRVEGVSWWPDEELSYAELGDLVQLFEKCKPRIMISHECPSKANEVLLRDLTGSYFFAKGALAASRTCQALQNMLDLHQPDEWIFGHYHVNKEFTVPGYKTKFICVGELQTYEVEV